MVQLDGVLTTYKWRHEFGPMKKAAVAKRSCDPSAGEGWGDRCRKILGAC